MSRKTGTWKVAVLMAVFCLVSASSFPLSGEAQFPGSGKVPVLDTYFEILNRVFPRERDWINKRYFLTVRYLPSFSHESQITVTETAHNQYSVLLQRLEGNRSIWVQLQEAVGKLGALPDAVQFAKEIKIDTKAVKVSGKELDRVMEAFPKIDLRINLRNSALTLDGEIFQMWFDSQEISINWSTNYGGYLGRDDPPFIRWANDLRETVMRAANK